MLYSPKGCLFVSSLSSGLHNISHLLQVDSAMDKIGSLGLKFFGTLVLCPPTDWLRAAGLEHLLSAHPYFLHRIVALGFSGCHLQPHSCDLLSQSLPSLCQLHSLSLSSNAIGSTLEPTPSPPSFYLASSTDTGIESVVPSTSLHTFSYHSSFLNACSQMSTSLPLSRLTFMPPSHLSSSLLSTSLAAWLIKALHNHSHLKSLKLDNTGTGLPECTALAQLLSSPTCSLERLNIGKNNLTFEATEVVITTLCQNCSLHYFYITASQIATNLMVPMISLPLIDLNLNYCHIGPEGSCEIATALCDHTVIQYLYISHVTQ